MSRRPAVAALGATLFVLCAAAACSEPDPAASSEGLTERQFIDVVVALRSAEIELVGEEIESDSLLDVRFQAMRDSILVAHGTTEAELYDFLDGHPDLQYQSELWDTITQRLKRPRFVGSEPRSPLDSGDKPRPPPRPDRSLLNREAPIPR